MISILNIAILLITTAFTFNQCDGGETNYWGSSVSWRTLGYNNDNKIMVKAMLRKSFLFTCKNPGSWLCYEQSVGSTCGTLYNSSWECPADNSYYTSTSIVNFLQTADDLITYRSTGDQWWQSSTLYNQPTANSSPFQMNLARRADTGRPNASPVAFMPSYTRVYTGCTDALHIPTFDEDGDDVTCRFGENTFENGDAINNYPYFTLDEERCVLNYNGGGIDYVPVTIIVEDHSTSNPAITYSYVPLQFVVRVVYTASPYCDKNPVIETPSSMEKFTVNSGEEFHLVVHARKDSSQSSIRSIQVNGAPHMKADHTPPLNLGNNLYQTNFTWIPAADDQGQNFICFVAFSSINHRSEQICVIISVDEASKCDPQVDPDNGHVNCSSWNQFNSICTFSCQYAYALVGDPISQCGVEGWNTSAPTCQPGCELQGATCSDTCDELSDSEFTCSCHRSCWELASDQAACIPKIEATCSEDRISAKVEKCAVDGDIILGDYEPDNDPPSPCLPAESSDFYHFDISLGECQSAVIDTVGGKRQSVLVKMWVEDPQQDPTNDSSPLARGSWYKVQVNCETEIAFDVSNSFDPDDSATSLVTEIGFGPIQFSFDFFRNSTFQEIYENDEYPIGYHLEDHIYFGIVARSNDSDVELFTKSCQAAADPNPESISHVALIDDGCLMDETMRDYPASDPLRNHFSIEAFRFKTSLPGITEATDVRIECRVVVCLQLENVTTTCSEACVNRPARSVSADAEFLTTVERHVVADERVLIANGKVSKLTPEDEQALETNSILLKKSGRIHLIEDSQGRGSRTHLHITETVFMAVLVALLFLA